MYDISPYATFSVSGPESRSVTASTLDYTVQFKTFGMIEVEDGPDRVMNSQCGTPGKCGRHQMYPDGKTICKIINKVTKIKSSLLVLRVLFCFVYYMIR